MSILRHIWPCLQGKFTAKFHVMHNLATLGLHYKDHLLYITILNAYSIIKKYINANLILLHCNKAIFYKIIKAYLRILV